MSDTVIGFVVLALVVVVGVASWIAEHSDGFWDTVVVILIIGARVIFWLAVVIIGIYCLTRLL